MLCLLMRRVTCNHPPQSGPQVANLIGSLGLFCACTQDFVRFSTLPEFRLQTWTFASPTPNFLDKP